MILNKNIIIIKLLFHQGVTEFVEATVKRMLPGDYCQRQKIHEDEMNELLGKGAMYTNIHVK